MQVRIIFPILLFLSAALSWWFVSSLDYKSPETPIIDLQNPDYFMHGVRTTVMNPDGTPKQELYARFLAHYKHQNRTQLDDPDLILHRKDGSVWKLSAKQGMVYENDRKIFLQGSVKISKSGASGLTIDAQDMTIFPDKHTAQTNKPVVISSKDSSVRANSMHADLKHQRLKLATRVRGHYVP